MERAGIAKIDEIPVGCGLICHASIMNLKIKYGMVVW
jgi:hypothetical protein